MSVRLVEEESRIDCVGGIQGPGYITCDVIEATDVRSVNRMSVSLCR